MTRGGHERGSVGALDAGDFAEQRAAVRVDDHNPILAGDKETVIGGIGHDVIPAAISAQRVGSCDAVRLREERRHGSQREDKRDVAHDAPF